METKMVVENKPNDRRLTSRAAPSCRFGRLNIEFTAQHAEIIGKTRITPRCDRRALCEFDVMHRLDDRRAMAKHDDAFGQCNRFVR